MKPPMKLWAFHEAPEELQALSTNGGDEDWLLLVPAGIHAPYWLDINGGGRFGVCGTDEHALEDGSTVFIGYHS